MWQKSRDTNGVLQADLIRFPAASRAWPTMSIPRGSNWVSIPDHGLQSAGKALQPPRPAGYAFGYTYLDANTFAAWGVDYLKYDNCTLPSGDVLKNTHGPHGRRAAENRTAHDLQYLPWSFASWQPYLGNSGARPGTSAAPLIGDHQNYANSSSAFCRASHQTTICSKSAMATYPSSKINRTSACGV